jgi:hypothetical protein
LRAFKRSALPFKRPLPADPPADATLWDWEDIPIAIFSDGSVVGYDPDPRPMSDRCKLMAYPRSREDWDELRLWHVEYRAMQAVGGEWFEAWRQANNEAIARHTREVIDKWLEETRGRWA